MMIKRAYGHELNRAVTTFFDHLDSVLSSQKAALHKKLFRFPVETYPLCEEIRSDLENIFDGQDPIFKYDFLDSDLEADWMDYQKIQLKEMDTWRHEGLEAMIGRINSVIIVDAPAEQTTERPQPYFYFQHISGVHDYDLNSDGSIDWISTKTILQDENGENIYKLSVFDDTSYRVFIMDSAAFSEITSLDVESPHDLGYCPAQWFWRDSITSSEKDIKKSPASAYLGLLDKLLLSMLSKDVLDLTAGNPMLWFFQGTCDYENVKTGEKCVSGFLHDQSDNYIVSRDSQKPKHCPACHESRFPGPGSFIGVDPPEEDSNINMREPAGWVQVDVASLEAAAQRVDQLKKDIYSGITGNTFESINKQAINEDQVKSFFESRKKTYFSIKRNFEYIQSWTDKTLCKIRYGEAFQGLSINYGTEFFLFTSEGAMEAYKNAKDAKLSAFSLDMLADQHIMTRYRHNQDQIERAKIFNNLDPFRHLSHLDLLPLLQNNQIEYEDFYLKMNLSSLIARFERENQGTILQFGRDIPFHTKIDRIKEALLTYIVKPEPEPLPEPEPQIL